MRVLIVDDNEMNRFVMRNLLETYANEREDIDFNILEVETGREALNFVSSATFELILMDIMMPDMDGIEATKKIREFDREALIIAVSAIVDSETKQQQIFQVGANAFLPKPILIEDFFELLDRYLKH